MCFELYVTFEYVILNECIYFWDILATLAEIFLGINVKCQILPDFDHNFKVSTDFIKIVYFMKFSSVIPKCCRPDVETGMVNLPYAFVQLFTVTQQKWH
jgi:hypothetical protein